uniref:Uncharacterized protein n=1 Tax=Megaselia scalaris TaxID=36166 RepID=T1GY21_MEGSC
MKNDDEKRFFKFSWNRRFLVNYGVNYLELGELLIESRRISKSLDSKCYSILEVEKLSLAPY